MGMFDIIRQIERCIAESITNEIEQAYGNINTSTTSQENLTEEKFREVHKIVKSINARFWRDIAAHLLIVPEMGDLIIFPQHVADKLNLPPDKPAWVKISKYLREDRDCFFVFRGNETSCYIGPLDPGRSIGGYGGIV